MHELDILMSTQTARNAIEEAGFHVPYLLINAISELRHQIATNAVESLRKADLTPQYKEILALSPEGVKRVDMVIGLVQEALKGDIQPLLEDQAYTGRIRVLQGVPLQNTIQAHSISEFEITRAFIRLYSDSTSMDISLKDLHEELSVLNYVYYKAKETIIDSYLNTRDEFIDKRNKQIEGLYKLRNMFRDNFNISQFTQSFTREVSRILSGAHVILTINSGTNKRFLPAFQVGSSSLALDLFANEVMSKILSKMVQIRGPCLVDHKGMKQFPINPESIEIIPTGYWLVIPIFTKIRFYGFLSIDTEKLGEQLFGADSYVILSAVSEIAQAMEKNQYLIELRKNQKTLHRLTNRIIYLQEEERKRISANIHDTIIQRLTGIWYKLLYMDEISQDTDNTLGELFVSLKKYVNDSIVEGRRIVYMLRPLMLEELGVQKTIEEYVNNYMLENAIVVDVVFKGDLSRLSPAKQTTLFRILQEAMENIKKHSNSKKAIVTIKCTEPELTFSVEDFGSGTGKRSLKASDIGKTHFGLIIIDERVKAFGGRVRYGFKKSGGFIVKGKIPIHKKVKGAK